MHSTNSSKTLLAGLAATAVLTLSSGAYAADEDVLPTSNDSIEEFWKADSWTIFKNDTRQSCFIEWRGESSVVQAGLTTTPGVGYLGGFIQGAEPEEGVKDVAILLNGNIYLGNVATVSGTLPGEYKGSYIVFNEPNFVSDLEEAKEFIAFPDSPYVASVSLKTPANAVARARTCMESF